MTIDSAQDVAATTQRPPYRPIGQYGVIGDCRTAALIGPDGAVDWLCLPHFDSPAVFCRLLDADQGGYFQVSPAVTATSHMEYLDGTNIMQTLFRAESNEMRLVDFMPVRPRQRGWPQVNSLASGLASLLPLRARRGAERDVGNDVAAAHRITRLVTSTSGELDVAVTLKPTFDYARKAATIAPVPLADGLAAAIISDGQRHLVLYLRLEGQPAPPPITLDIQDGVIRTQVHVAQGQRLAVMLNYARDAQEAQVILHRLARRDVDADLAETLAYWRAWAAGLRYTGPYQQAILRSALALKLCTFEPTGAIVAAPTTSLPEAIGGVRNWDYRFTWLRDASFTLDALQDLGFTGEARDYFHFLHDLHLRDGSELRVMYGIHGETGPALAEHELPNLAGYRGSRPVRIGNGAATQRQMDIYGELMDAAYHYYCHGQEKTRDRRHESLRSLHRLVAIIADYVTDHWQTTDRGIWEVRGAARAFVHSRVMCWLALDRACRMAARWQRGRAKRWAAARDAIRADVLAHGYNDAVQSFTQAYGDTVLDAADLRLAIVDFLPPTDPRIQHTVLTTDRELATQDGLVYRYKPAGATRGDISAPASGEADDGLPGGEGAFAVCSFWLIRALCQIGHVAEARDRFNAMLGYASPLGLFSEEIDPDTGALLGNYPQAFTHIGLITAAVALQRAEEGRSE